MGSDISRRVFYPQPNVDSALVEITRRTQPGLPSPGVNKTEDVSSEAALGTQAGLTAPQATEREAVFNLIDQAFASRRKMLRAGLKTWAQPLAAVPLLKAGGIDPTQRAENLEIKDFAVLARLRKALIAGFENLAESVATPGEQIPTEAVTAPDDTPNCDANAKGKTSIASANGKINLALACGKSLDGYHDLTTVFQAVNVRETVKITLRPRDIELQTFFSAPPGAVGYDSARDQEALADLDPLNNLATRAFLLVASRCGYQGGARIQVTKQVPVAAGMAGGSADGAAALLAANQVLQAGLNRKELAELGASLGADVPFGLYGGTCFGDRHGDRITPLPPAKPLHLVVAVSPQTLPTPQVFKQFDQQEAARASLPKLADLAALLTAVYTGDFAALSELVFNDLQLPALKLLPELTATLEAAKEQGALPFISGSGPSVACLVETADQATKLATSLAQLEQVAYALPLAFSAGDPDIAGKQWLA